MTSKDDDTLPLPEFSQELTPNTTADEDFIPTSQPQSSATSKISRNSDNSFSKSSEELNSLGTFISRIDETLPREVTVDQLTFENNKSADFIPDTETKRIKINYIKEDLSCKKKLPIFGTEDAFSMQQNPTWCDVSRIPESPALNTQNLSILKEYPTQILLPNQETAKEREDSTTEVIVYDSAETVDLETTPVKMKKSESGEKSEIFSSSDMERCEETRIFDNSSVLLLDEPGPSGLGLKSSEGNGETIEKSYIQETVDDNKENSQDRANGYHMPCSPALVTDQFSKKVGSVKQEAVSVATSCQNKVQANPICSVRRNNLVETRKVEFKLRVSCLVSVNTGTNKILQKTILDVKENLKPKLKPKNIEPLSDNTSEKSKRHSTSSSGSVYSDKTGLPFTLPKRLSFISDQTDSSEDDFTACMKREKRKLERTPWENEYLFPLAMDDVIHTAIEREELFKRPVMSSPRKPKTKHCNEVKQLKEILESASSSQTTLGDIGELAKVNDTVERMEDSGNSVKLAEKTDESMKDTKTQNETDTSAGSENVHFYDKQEQSLNEPEKQIREEEETTSISLSKGLPVFARWTDKRYYSGVLSGDVKNDRWDLKFDDGTVKAVREDLIMPADWLKVGALVFALVDDKYVSGQIISIKRGKEIEYIVELDTEKKEISVKISDLCLTDVMAGIVREKYKPLSGTPRGRADIDFDNVLSGKRLREQRTPLKPPVTIGAGNSALKKKSSKVKKDERQNMQSIKETPENKIFELKIEGLKSDNGHLVEDKVVSTDSPSGNEILETPIRKSLMEPKPKAKPRSLSYEIEESRSVKGKSWLAPDGTPIPGPSGVKPKKNKIKTKAEPGNSFPEETAQKAKKSSKKSLAKAAESSEKNKKKRKLNESVEEENVKKKSLKEETHKVKTRNRKG